MTWVKKNLFILITAVVSLGLLGFAGFFVKSKVDKDAEVTATLDESAEKFKTLLSRKVHPGNEKVDNIKTAKEELVKMRGFMDEMREYIKGPDIATNLNNQIFRATLDTSIAQLRRGAVQANVTLPNTNYWFTFSGYKTTVDFKGDINGLAAELEDIKAMMKVIYEARVHSLAGLRRVQVSENEYGNNQEHILNRYPRTNDWAITTGYEVTFQGFSSELARVMEGMANAKETFVVKTVGVAQAPEERKPGPAMPMQMMPPPTMNPYGDPRMRYGMGVPRPGPAPFIPAPQRAIASGGTQLARVLDENKLRFTLQVDSIRLKPKAR